MSTKLSIKGFLLLISVSPPLLRNQFHNSWLYDEMAQEFAHWLPKESLKSLQYAGYFMIKKGPNLRVIVMNNDYCTRLNIWTYYKSIDPADHLKWLVYQLDLAEKDGDYVHIVGHIPPDTIGCYQSWLYNYMAIIERYMDIIVGQFYGHNHSDEFRVYYSVNNSTKPIGFAILSPSVTTYQMLNPAYRIIHCNENGEIIDMITFAFNLAQANNNSVPKWYREYSWSETYSMKQFNAISFDGLLNAIDTDDRLMQTYYTFYSRNSPLFDQGCDKQCKTDVFLSLKVLNPFLNSEYVAVNQKYV